MGHQPEAMATEEKSTSQTEKHPDQDRRETSGGERKKRRKTHGTIEWTHELEQPRQGQVKEKGEQEKRKEEKGKKEKGLKETKATKKRRKRKRQKECGTEN